MLKTQTLPLLHRNNKNAAKTLLTYILCLDMPFVTANLANGSSARGARMDFAGAGTMSACLLNAYSTLHVNGIVLCAQLQRKAEGHIPLALSIISSIVMSR